MRSSDSFAAYLLEEMTFDDGVTDLVDKYNEWILEEFETIYAALGGHAGFFL